MSELTSPFRRSLNTSITRPSREKSENRGAKLLWLDKNENMDLIYREFTQKLIADLPAEAIFSYPDCHILYEKLSRYLDVPINQIIIAAGSDGVIRTVYDAFINPGDTVIYTEPTFAMYSIYAEMYGAKSYILHYDASAHGPYLGVDTVVNAINEAKPKLVCLPNPNSPSGTVFPPDDLRCIIEAAQATGAMILIDEAYHPFYVETVVPLVADFSNLIVARTFSKAWGCAGIRLGYGVASAELTSVFHKIRPMYEAGALSFTVAERLLDYPEQMLQSVERLNEGKNYFLKEMASLGLRTFRAEGNFLHVNFGEHKEAVHAALRNKVLYRLDFSHPSLAGYSRFSTTTKDIFATFVPVITKIIKDSTL